MFKRFNDLDPTYLTKRETLQAMWRNNPSRLAFRNNLSFKPDESLTDYDLAGIDIREYKIKNFHFNDISFNQSVIKNCHFENVQFHKNFFEFAELIQCTFKKCYFSYPHFKASLIHKSSFEECTFSGITVFDNCRFYETIFNNCSFNGRLTWEAFLNCFLERNSFIVNPTIDDRGFEFSKSKVFKNISHSYAQSGAFTFCRNYYYLSQEAYTTDLYQYYAFDEDGKPRLAHNLNRDMYWETIFRLLSQILTGYSVRPHYTFGWIFFFSFILFPTIYSLLHISNPFFVSAGAFYTFGILGTLPEGFFRLIFILEAFLGVVFNSLFIVTLTTFWNFGNKN